MRELRKEFELLVHEVERFDTDIDLIWTSKYLCLPKFHRNSNGQSTVRTNRVELEHDILKKLDDFDSIVHQRYRDPLQGTLAI